MYVYKKMCICCTDGTMRLTKWIKQFDVVLSNCLTSFVLCQVLFPLFEKSLQGQA